MDQNIMCTTEGGLSFYTAVAGGLSFFFMDRKTIFFGSGLEPGSDFTSVVDPE